MLQYRKVLSWGSEFGKRANDEQGHHPERRRTREGKVGERNGLRFPLLSLFGEARQGCLYTRIHGSMDRLSTSTTSRGWGGGKRMQMRSCQQQTRAATTTKKRCLKW